MHVLYLVFRVVVELLVIVAIADLLVSGFVTVRRTEKAGKHRISYFTILYVSSLVAALIMRLYVFNPIVSP